jgi:P-type Ca2+ transporter type 2C
MATKSVYPAWSKSVDEVLRHHQVEPLEGLSAAQVEEGRQVHGFNELEKPPSPSMWTLILQQFDDTLVKVRACRCESLARRQCS